MDNEQPKSVMQNGPLTVVSSALGLRSYLRNENICNGELEKFNKCEYKNT